MQVTVHQAQAELAKLLDAVERGEEVIIARDETPVAEIVPFRRKQKFKLGMLADQLKGPIPDFLEPMSEEDLRLWERASSPA